MSECEKYEIHKIRDQQICVVKLGSKFKIVIVELEDKANFYVIRKGSFSSFEKIKNYIRNEIISYILHKILRNYC